jgi:hypothetical protein
MYLNLLRKDQKKKRAEYIRQQEIIHSTLNQVRCPNCNLIFGRPEFKLHSRNCDNIIKYDIVMSIREIKDPDIVYNDFLKDKRVVLVAPSKSVLKTIQGDHIDSYDIVVRLNKSLPIPSYLHQAIGSRTDILYNNLNTTDFPGENNLNLYELKNTIQYICCPYPPITPFSKDIMKFQRENTKYNIPFHHINLKYYNSILNNIKTRPNTGICAILDILNHDIKELYITGITFFSDGHYDGYSSTSNQRIHQIMNSNNIHQQEPQIKLLRRLVLSDSRIEIDIILYNILFNIYNKVIETLQKFSFKHCFCGPKQNLLPRTFLDVIKNNSSVNIIFKFNKSTIITNNPKIDNSFKSIIVTIANRNEIKLHIQDTDTHCSLRIMEPHKYTEKIEYTYYLNGIYTKYLVKQMKRIDIINISVELFALLYFSTLYSKHNIYADELQTNQIEVNFYKYMIKQKLFTSL